MDGPERSDGPAAEDLDALRRRVYAPGATEEDRQRYRDALAAASRTAAALSARPSGTGGAERPAAPGRRRPRGLVLAAALLVVLVGGAALAAALLTGSPDAPSASSTPLAPSAASVPARPVEAARAVAVPPATARGFVADLRAGRPADVAGYVTRHPDLLPPQLRGAARADTSQLTGAGPAVLALDPSALADRGGRVTVALVLDHRTRVVWTAGRSGRLDGAGGASEVLASAVATPDPGVPAAATVRYRGRGPDRLGIDLPVGVRWGATVVLSD